MKRILQDIYTVVAINISGTVVVIILLELMLGRWLYQKPFKSLKRPPEVRVNFHLKTLPGFAGKNTALYVRDQWGFRGEYRSVQDVDILTLGGSTVDQRYIGEGLTWQDALRRKFADEEKIVSVVNAGVDGHSTFGVLESFPGWFAHIPGLHVRYFLVYLSSNDVLPFKRGDDAVRGLQQILDFITVKATRVQFFHQRLEEPVPILQEHPLTPLLRKRSILFHWYSELLRQDDVQQMWVTAAQSDNVHLVKDWVSAPLLRNHSQEYREDLEKYRQRLRTLMGSIRSYGAGAIFVTEPSRLFYQENGQTLGLSADRYGMQYRGKPINGVDFAHFHEFLRQATIDTCQEFSDCLAIDLAGELKLEHQDFYNFSHTNAKGAEKVGAFLHEKLKDLF